MRLLSWLLPAAGYEVKRQGGSLEEPIQVNIISIDRNFSVKGRVSDSDLWRFEKEATLVSAPEEPTNDHPPCRGKEFSPIERSIMDVMEKADGWLTKAEVAAACGQSQSSWFGYALANLADREYLESGRNGYRLRRLK